MSDMLRILFLKTVFEAFWILYSIALASGSILWSLQSENEKPQCVCDVLLWWLGQVWCFGIAENRCWSWYNVMTFCKLPYLACRHTICSVSNLYVRKCFCGRYKRSLFLCQVSSSGWWHFKPLFCFLQYYVEILVYHLDVFLFLVTMESKPGWAKLILMNNLMIWEPSLTSKISICAWFMKMS